MSFSISVHRCVDDPYFASPPDVSSADFDQWFAWYRERTLYDNPLGADGTVYELWHVPAKTLGLRLLVAVYNEGLVVAGRELETLSAEADKLEAFWDSLDLGNMPPYVCESWREDGSWERTYQSVREHLKERMGYLREAIQIARAKDGTLTIG
jgi:hypothetical protein